MGADIVDDDGKSVKPGEPGELVLRRPSIGLSRGLWNDREGFLRTYWSTFSGSWVQRDLAMRDKHGLWYLLGRSDDTIKIAGKRTGPAEIESLILSAGLVSEVGVVGIPDAISGTVLACVCVARLSVNKTLEAEQVASLVADSYGKPYRPAVVLFVQSLPKTRNQKIVRRAIRAALTGEPLGDVSAIGNPHALEEIRVAMNEHAGHEMSCT
jgi:acetyl-CoA synthetase